MSIRVALLDSGVNTEHPHIPDGSVTHGPRLEGTDLVVDESPTDDLGHGTCVAAAILDLAPGTCIYSIRVFDDAPTCDFEGILVALDHAIDDASADLVNLSLGTLDPEFGEALAVRLARLRARGGRLIAPAIYGGLPAFPGSLDGADGVVVDAQCERGAPERRSSGGAVVWHASPYPRDLPGLPRTRNLTGVSLAAANLTGFLARDTSEPGV